MPIGLVFVLVFSLEYFAVGEQLNSLYCRSAIYSDCDPAEWKFELLSCWILFCAVSARYARLKPLWDYFGRVRNDSGRNALLAAQCICVAGHGGSVSIVTWLRDGRCGIQIPANARNTSVPPKCPERLWGPHSLLNECWDSSQGVKRP